MSQEFQVLRCCSCQTFQVHQVKKAKKWSCKLCGQKQSYIKVYGQGGGLDCRKHVQKLNMMRGELRGESESQTPLDYEEQEEKSQQCYDYPTEPPVAPRQPRVNKWEQYVSDDDNGPHPESDDEAGGVVYTTSKQKFDTVRKERKALNRERYKKQRTEPYKSQFQQRKYSSSQPGSNMVPSQPDSNPDRYSSQTNAALSSYDERSSFQQPRKFVSKTASEINADRYDFNQGNALHSVQTRENNNMTQPSLYRDNSSREYSGTPLNGTKLQPLSATAPNISKNQSNISNINAGIGSSNDMSNRTAVMNKTHRLDSHERLCTKSPSAFDIPSPFRHVEDSNKDEHNHKSTNKLTKPSSSQTKTNNKSQQNKLSNSKWGKFVEDTRESSSSEEDEANIENMHIIMNKLKGRSEMSESGHDLQGVTKSNPCNDIGSDPYNDSAIRNRFKSDVGNALNEESFNVRRESGNSFDIMNRLERTNSVYRNGYKDRDVGTSPDNVIVQKENLYDKSCKFNTDGNMLSDTPNSNRNLATKPNLNIMNTSVQFSSAKTEPHSNVAVNTDVYFELSDDEDLDNLISQM